jgi:shikimate kinase
VVAIHRAREPYYRQADVTVDTTHRTTDQVVAEILRALRPILSPSGRGEA